MFSKVENLVEQNENLIFLPDLANGNCGVLPGPLVGDDDELDLVALLEDLVLLDLAGVEEQLLALLNLVAQESEGT